MAYENPVERASLADIPELVVLRLAYLTEDLGGIDEQMSSRIHRDLPRYFSWHLGRDCTAYVIRDGNGLIAACALLLVIDKPMSPSFPTGRTGTVLNVYTRPEHRRLGHATRLMSELLADATQNDLSVVDLMATEDGYPVYQKVGFEDNPAAKEYRLMRWINPAVS